MYPSWQDYEYYCSSMSIHFHINILAKYQYDGTTEGPSLEQLQGQTACTRLRVYLSMVILSIGHFPCESHLRAVMFGHFCGHLGPSIVCLSSVTRQSKKLFNPS